MAAVTLDYADIRMLEAATHGAEFLTYTVTGSDWRGHLNRLYALHAAQDLTPDNLLTHWDGVLM